MSDRKRITPYSARRSARLAALIAACVAASASAQSGNEPKDESWKDVARATTESQKQQQGQQSQQRADEQFTVKPESLSFERRPLFTSATEAFWVRGKSSEKVRIERVEVTGNNQDAFSVTNGCKEAVRNEQDCRIDVKFTPQSPGEKAAEVRIVTADGSVRTRQVTGSGVQAEYKVSAQTLRFGQVGQGDGGKQQKVTITNTGEIPLPITATSLSGPNEKQFEQANDCPQELAPGRSCSSTVVFRPTYKGHHEATLTVWAKGGAPETKIALSGTGA
jgi:hypothetical protein